MPITPMQDLIQNGLGRAVELMAVAAHNSFRFNDRNTVRMQAVDGEDLEQIAEYCFSLGDMSPLAARDGRHLVQLMKEPCTLLLIGDKRKSDFNYNCGACGYRTCADMNAAEEVESLTANGPSCKVKHGTRNRAPPAAAAMAPRRGTYRHQKR